MPDDSTIYSVPQGQDRLSYTTFCKVGPNFGIGSVWTKERTKLRTALMEFSTLSARGRLAFGFVSDLNRGHCGGIGGCLFGVFLELRQSDIHGKPKRAKQPPVSKLDHLN